MACASALPPFVQPLFVLMSATLCLSDVPKWITMPINLSLLHNIGHLRIACMLQNSEVLITVITVSTAAHRSLRADVLITFGSRQSAVP